MNEKTTHGAQAESCLRLASTSGYRSEEMRARLRQEAGIHATMYVGEQLEAIAYALLTKK